MNKNKSSKAASIVKQAIKEMTPKTNSVPTTKGANENPTPITITRPKKGPFRT